MDLHLSIEPRVEVLAAAVSEAGGRALVVGGIVRDHLLGRESKDCDLEVYGLPLERLEEVLSRFGEVITIGRSFGVLKVKGLDADVSIPRKDSKTGRGHRGFVVELDPALDFAAAARRRDLTINSMGYDPLRHELLDPWGGRRDLERRVLRATDPASFPEDPLRALRVAQFYARFEMEPDAELCRICADLDLAELAGERVFDEFRKLLGKARRPSLGFSFLERTGLLRFWPELAAMVGVPQDAEWHPEGTVWEHTLMVVDEAAALRAGEETDLALTFGALLHDVGKPATTVEEGGRIRSPGHEEAGVPLTRSFFERLRAPHRLIEQVVALVRFHLAPAQLPQQGASLKAYRRLARRLAEAEVAPELLLRVATADHFGRTTPDALARQFPAGEAFGATMASLAVEGPAGTDVVLGRHLIARGFAPGPSFGPLLAACRELQEETGWQDPERILGRVLAARSVHDAADDAAPQA